MPIEKLQIKINTVGSAGSAVGSAIVALPPCELLEVYNNYHADAPATTDVTYTAPGNPAQKTILTVTNSKTDAYFRPRLTDHDTSGASGGSRAIPVIHNGLQIDVAQCDQLTDAVIIDIHYRR